MSRRRWVLVGLVLVGAALGAFLYLRQPPEVEPRDRSPARPENRADDPAVQDAQDRPPAPSAPAPPSEPAKPLPPLDDSDRVLLGELSERFGFDPVASFLVSSGIARKLVATVDALDRERVPGKIRALAPLDGRFEVERDGATTVLGVENFERYDPLMRVLASLDVQVAVELYARFYPLLQQAYRELGYPERQFNDRLLEVVDHVLAAPEPAYPIRLRRPHERGPYQYAEPKQESLSAGRKLLLRMGPEHARTVKSKLRALRAELLARSRVPHTPGP